ncbi:MULTISPECIES: diacylglycerol kinase family protein [Pelosinus]|uniref:Diacylglycerol kinase n=1 Tax=Pelosinus fermentans B4 TaxID=1149862 RepID=I9LA84_9FIRM|nr:MULTISPECIES: diacylglycerol kinase family protein [Pelosinus]EIW17216.1 diacylglycerol kinase [Pelosinus fermentans B4]EIW22985.1 diacylglycerol kinase [Pelosinus fermentans A11]OAM93974.1 diacylglycerol kinase [Pelosinus fermentans DSM 17108]SDQ96012.1 diacylglycerol kinase (ATP) [Pelosinus fermentans]
MRKKQSLLISVKSAFEGIYYCATHERNMKIHIGAGLTAGFFSWWFALDKYEILILLVTIVGVLVAEMINTVVETLVDMISPERHPLAKIAKDVAAGAVLITATFSLVVGYMLFFSKL